MTWRVNSYNAGQVAKLKADLQELNVRLVDALQRAARAEGELDGLRATVAALQQADRLDQLVTANQELRDRIAELEQQLRDAYHRATRQPSVYQQQGGGHHGG